MRFYRVTITRVYVGVFEAPTKQRAVDRAFAADDSGETINHTVEEITEAEYDDPNTEMVRDGKY